MFRKHREILKFICIIFLIKFLVYFIIISIVKYKLIEDSLRAVATLYLITILILIKAFYKE